MELRRAQTADAEGVADVFLRSFKAALPTVRLAHSDDDVRGYIRDVLIPGRECWVTVSEGTVVAMMALRAGWIDQLYVAPEWIGRGVGRQLLDLAKERAGERGDRRLELWAFQCNDRARRFYERNGFVAAELTDGAGNEEREPDVRYVWERPLPAWPT